MAHVSGENKNWVRTFQVTQPVRHKNGFTVYKVVSKMFQRTFPEGVTSITVWKRYTDFKKLYTGLQLTHSQLHLKGEFPKFPKARLFGRFDYEVVERRRKSALNLLEFAARHSVLFASKIFIKFFENGYSVTDLLITSNCEDDHNQQDFDTCLIPDRLWCQPLSCENKDNVEDCDGASASSVGSTPPGTAANTIDSNSLISCSALNCGGEILVNGAGLPLQNNSHITTPSATLNSKSSSSSVFSLDKLKNSSTSDAISSTQRVDGDSVMSLSHDTSLSSFHRPVSVSMSCSSLSSIGNPTLIRPMDKSESSTDLQVVESLSSDTGRLNLDKKKPNGFGFFDFLPIFSKKESGKDGKTAVEKLLNDSLTASYICEAAGHFAVAQQHESNREFQKSFRSYKEGIRILLVGAKDDSDLKRKRLVKSKLDKYLHRAEYLYENHLTLSPNPNPSQNDDADCGHITSVSPVSFNSEKVWQNTLVSGIAGYNKKLKTVENMKPSPINELKEYKFIRVIYKHVYLVVNIKISLKPKFYAIKILLKSSSPIYISKPTLIPNSIPFMAKLLQWFETDHSYILVIQYASGGQLKDFVDLYQTRSILLNSDLSHSNVISHTSETSSGVDSTPGVSTSADQSELTNDMLSVLDALAQLGSDKENCESYNRLFEEYSETIHDNRTQLATYSKHKSQAPLSVIETSGNETSEISSKSIVPFEELQTENFIESESTNMFQFVSPPLFSPLSLHESAFEYEPDKISNTKNFDTIGTQKLIESSKVLLETVNQTLAADRCIDNGDCDTEAMLSVSFSKSFENIGKDSLSHVLLKQKSGAEFNRIESLEPEKSNKLRNSNKNKGNPFIAPCESMTVEEEDEGIQSSCEGGNGENEQHQFQSQSDNNEFSTKSIEKLILSSNSSLNTQDNRKDIVCPETTESEVECQIPKRMVPECCIKIWAAEIILALEKLHNYGLAFGDLEIKNILLGENGHILLSLASQWSEVDQTPEIPYRKNEFSAPEIRNSSGLPMWKIHPSSDFWSLGVILFELITGQTLMSAHPEGFLHSDSVLKIPDKNLVGDLISHHGKTLLAELLQYTPSLRLGYYGAAEVKSHPFFEGFDWESVLEAVCSVGE